MNTAAILVTQDPNDRQRSSWSSKEHPIRESPKPPAPSRHAKPHHQCEEFKDYLRPRRSGRLTARSPHTTVPAQARPHHTAGDSAHEPARGDGHETFPTLPELYNASRRNHSTHGSTTACANRRRTATSEHSLRQPTQNCPTWLTIHTKTACRLRTLFLFDRCRRNKLA